KTKERPDGLSAAETYAGRGNLLYIIPGSGEDAGQSVALNAHVDVVAPYFPPRVKGGIVFGRGSCDDKGSVVAIVAALQILSEVMADAGLSWKHNVVAMLVIEEEPGGNGSLSLAMDRDLKKLYDSILIGEITSLKLHPANRGAVWYRAELKLPETTAPHPDPLPADAGRGRIAAVESTSAPASFPLPSRARGEGQGEGSRPPTSAVSGEADIPVCLGSKAAEGKQSAGRQECLPHDVGSAVTDRRCSGSLFEMAAFIIEELEKEGAAIRAESRHDLFPQRPVQTCHGIIGAYGEHPSRICGEVSFAIRFEAAQPECGRGLSAPTGMVAQVSSSRSHPESQAGSLRHSVGALRPLPHSERQKATEQLIRDCLDFAVAEYTGLYGDKTKVRDPLTGKPMVARHYDFRRNGAAFVVTVHGATGHMGSIRERDGAITKMSHMVRRLIRSRAKIESLAGGPMRLELGKAGRGAGGVIADFRKSAIMPSAAGGAAETLVLEGGQGFVPTHDIREVMSRLRAAAARGAENYLRLIGRPERGNDVVRVTYEKLHNAAFEGDPDSPTMRNAIAAAKTVGIWKDEPIRGWTVSCDARLFATEYPGMDVVTFGPGLLAHAHSDQEQISLGKLCQAVEFLAVFLLKQTGTL
ncbi:MAG: M20/M25/M40 family metallo-hydrolase, partial [Verrucomicrobia bacterium]|nr:M20/M25/M40 family metallo-hydrolase [Verrucomicrobiota bacterium]